MIIFVQLHEISIYRYVCRLVTLDFDLSRILKESSLDEPKQYYSV